MRLPSLLVTAVFCAAGFAHADVFTFNAQGSAGGFTAAGTLTANDNGDGSYTVVDITGPGVAGLIAPGQFEFNDNLLFPDQDGMLDIDGLSFNDVMGDTSYQVNIAYFDGAGYFTTLLDSDNNAQLLATDFSTSAVTPEPSSIALLGTGLLGIAGLARRRYVA